MPVIVDFLHPSVSLYNQDCLKALPVLREGAVDAVVTDPPYGLEFMGKGWDHGVPGIPFWQAIFRVLKLGGYLLSFGGTRTYHRLACAIEDAGFEVRDCVMWMYGTGFPKGKGCLKPAWEPILVGRKPGKKVLPLGIDECRIPTTDKLGGGGESPDNSGKIHEGWQRPWMFDKDAKEKHAAKVRANVEKAESLGRWPANVVHDGSEEVLEAFVKFGERKAGVAVGRNASVGRVYGNGRGLVAGPKGVECLGYGDTGSASRFFYCAKASRKERGEGNTHPTVKPLALMEWLVKLVAREGETVLDPFLGSATTAVACLRTGRRAVGIEQDERYYGIAEKRVREALGVG